MLAACLAVWIRRTSSALVVLFWSVVALLPALVLGPSAGDSYAAIARNGAVGSHTVTAKYSGKIVESFVYQPSNPAVWHEQLTFSFDEVETVTINAQGLASPGRPKLTLSGTITSTYAAPNAAKSCTGKFTVRPGAPSPFSFTNTTVVAHLPTSGTYAQSSSKSADCAVAVNQAIGVAGNPLQGAPASVLSVWSAAQPVICLFDKQPCRKTFNAESKSAQGSASLHATFVAGGGCASGPKKGLGSVGGCYVALGDSFSSGQAPSLVPGGEDCFRSKYAYALVYDQNADFVACSGATIPSVRERQLPAISRAAKLVTITVGGNDSGLIGQLVLCFVERLLRDCTVLKPPDFVSLRSRLADLYEAIHERAPIARIFVLGYPIAVPAKVPASCPDLFAPGLPLGIREEVPYFHQQLERLNATIKLAVADSRVARFVPTDQAFQGKDVCSPGSLFFGISLNNVELSLHPTRAGQAVMARLLRAAAGPPPE